jgi:hypothetical protein
MAMVIDIVREIDALFLFLSLSVPLCPPPFSFRFPPSSQYLILSSKTGPSVPRPPSMDSNEENEMDFDNLQDYMDQDIAARKSPTAESGPITPFCTDMPDWMNMTPEDLNLNWIAFPFLWEDQLHQKYHFKSPYR